MELKIYNLLCFKDIQNGVDLERKIYINLVLYLSLMLNKYFLNY